MINEKLEKLGLTKNEIAAYLALLELGKARAGSVIKKTKIHRNLVYQSLEKLIKRDLIAKSMTGGVATFTPHGLERLIEVMEERTELAKSLASELQKYRRAPLDVGLYEGQESLQRFFQHCASGERSVISCIGDYPILKLQEDAQFFRAYAAECAARDDSFCVLYEEEKKWTSIDLLRDTRIKRLPFSVALPSWIVIGRESVALGIASDSIVFIQIKSADLSRSFQSYFDYLWHQETAVLSGPHGVEELLDCVLREGKDLYLIGANGAIVNNYEEQYARFTDRRVQKEISLHMLGIETVRGTDFSRLPLSSMRYLPPGFESPMVVWIFGQTVAHVLWHSPEKIMLTRNKDTAGYYRRYFDALSQLSFP